MTARATAIVCALACTLPRARCPAADSGVTGTAFGRSLSAVAATDSASAGRRTAARVVVDLNRKIEIAAFTAAPTLIVW